MKEMTIETCKYVAVTDIIPDNWASWFYQYLSECSDLCWGTNNRSLVDADHFKYLTDMVFEESDHCEEEDYKKQMGEVSAKLDTLWDQRIYIDLEN